MRPSPCVALCLAFWLALFAAACAGDKAKASGSTESAPAAVPAAGPRPALEAFVSSTDGLHFEIDGDVVSQALLYGLAGDLHVSAAPGGGVRLDTVPAGSLFARLGLATGDVVKTINDVPITMNRESLIAAYADVRLSRRIELALERDAKPVALTYALMSGSARASRNRPGTSSYDVGPDPTPSALPPSTYTPTPPTPLSDEDQAKLDELDKSITKIDDTTYEITPDVIEMLFFGSKPSMTGARIVPSVKDGKANGFKLYAIRPSSVYKKIGFMNGDTITAINGQEITSMESMLEMTAALRKAKKIVFSLLRRGEDVALVLKVKAR